MDLMEAIRARHSVRRYTGQSIEGETLEALRAAIDASNRESGLHMQLCLDAPAAFDSMLARYGKFENARHFIALVGPKDNSPEERYGYSGEKVVLRATQLGLGTCWVAGTYSKRRSRDAVVIDPGEALRVIIAVGYGQGAVKVRKRKPIEALCRVEGPMPSWFARGMEAARLAPTAMNQQRFLFTLSGSTVQAKALAGYHTTLDLGIAKYHFEVGAGPEGWQWAP